MDPKKGRRMKEELRNGSHLNIGHLRSVFTKTESPAYAPASASIVCPACSLRTLLVRSK